MANGCFFVAASEERVKVGRQRRSDKNKDHISNGSLLLAFHVGSKIVGTVFCSSLQFDSVAQGERGRERERDD